MIKEPQTPKKDEVVKPPTPAGTGGEETPEETTPPGPGLPPDDVDYKKKFGESTTENQRIIKKNNRLIREKAELEVKLEKSGEALSESELEKAIPDYDLLNPEEQKEEKRKLIDRRRLARIEAKQKWQDDYAAMLSSLSPEMRKKLDEKGGEIEFKKFACSSENAGQKNLLNLAKQFLYEEAPTPEETPEVPEKPGLEDGSGGSHLPPAPPKKGFTTEEAAKMRKEDPQRYNKLSQEGKMKIID